MIDEVRRQEKQDEKERVRRRMRVEIDPENYEYIPEKGPPNFSDINVHQRVAVYVRVSTDDVQQTTSYELQQKYYKDFVEHHPNWELIDIYADEGISGTSLAHRDAFNRMIKDCKAGKIDLILTKSVSRFARNIVICIGMVRELAELRPPVGVLFESEAIFSLNEDSQMALSFLATMAEEESHTRSRSMETSLRMRLDNGIPLTPELLGYSHDENGNLVVNHEEARTVKLAFYMYLLCYTTQEIAEVFNQKRRRTFRGNVVWSPNTVNNILRNERYCGDVLTRKTFTPNFRDHLAKKNRGERPQSRYLNHHEAIVSRDDFVAVQTMLENARFQRSATKSLMPSLYVIDRGLLKGFVRMHPRWLGFSADDYIKAGESVFSGVQENDMTEEKSSSRFEIVRSNLLGGKKIFMLTISDGRMDLTKGCIEKLLPDYCAEVLIDPVRKLLAIRSSNRNNRRAVRLSSSYARVQPRNLASKPIYDVVMQIFGWEPENKYKIAGNLFEHDGTAVLIFDARCAEVYLKPYKLSPESEDEGEESILAPSGRFVQVMPNELVKYFGEQFWSLDQSGLERADWNLQEEGRLFETRRPMNITPEHVMRAYIKEELNREEDQNGEET